MYKVILITLFFLVSCVSQPKEEVPIIEESSETHVVRSSEIQKEIDDLLFRDAENKKLELDYLEQIRIAQENNDTEAFEFYFQEYVNVERLDIPEELKKEPNYFQGGIKVKY